VFVVQTRAKPAATTSKSWKTRSRSKRAATTPTRAGETGARPLPASPIRPERSGRAHL